VNIERVGAAGPGREILAFGVRLREGATVVARVLAASAEDGFGLLSLAGARVRAQLPQALREGETLRLLVVGTLDDKVVLKLVRAEAGTEAKDVPARVIAEMATKGDGELLRAATTLAGGVVPLPGGLLAAIDPEETPEGMQDAEGNEPHALRLVIHSPILGAIEMRIALIAGRLGVGVTAEPGPAFSLASEAQIELTRRLEAVTGLPAAVGVAVRQGPPPEAPAPPDLGEVGFYA
jgi:hypothetical protein